MLIVFHDEYSPTHSAPRWFASDPGRPDQSPTTVASTRTLGSGGNVRATSRDGGILASRTTKGWSSWRVTRWRECRAKFARRRKNKGDVRIYADDVKLTCPRKESRSGEETTRTPAAAAGADRRRGSLAMAARRSFIARPGPVPRPRCAPSRQDWRPEPDPWPPSPPSRS